MKTTSLSAAESVSRTSEKIDSRQVSPAVRMYDVLSPERQTPGRRVLLPDNHPD